ncbi:MAG: ATP-binding protein [Methylacidiphilales bacterium]|nr:ATP-binding protein [Candidatus Methylacidiphilales bacterium]MDW8349341.1 ATP-binding protein [Verrucomicrobiae bacterium]
MMSTDPAQAHDHPSLVSYWPEIIESITEGFLLIAPAPDWQGLFINREAQRLLNLPRENFIAHNIWHHPTFQQLDLLRSMLIQAWQDRMPLHFEDEFPHKDKASPRNLEFHIYPTPTTLCIHVTDITTRKQHAIAIARLAAFAQFNPNPFFEISRQAQILYTNTAAQQTAEKLHLPTPKHLLPPQYPEITRELLQTPLISKSLEHSLCEHIFQWHFFAIREHQIVHAHGIDITDRVRLEAHLRQVQKTESIGQLAGGIAHDFNNLLTVIQGYAQMIERDPQSPESIRHHAQEIISTTQRAASLTRQLLAYSRRQIAQPKPLDLSATLLRLIDLLHPLLGERISIQFREDHKIPLIYADENMIEQVVMNLCVNARDAMMPQGGTLTLALSTANLTEDQNPKIRTPGPHVSLSISDTGCGIPQEIQSKIFEPFFTTKEVGKGTGLGLAVVEGIVRQHNGWIELKSAPGQGTTFTIYLPTYQNPTETISQNSIPSALHTPPPPTHTPPPTKTILIVEDQANLRRLARLTLQKAGYTILEAESPAQARKIWEKERDRIDLVFTDIVMPGQENGLEMAAAFVQEKPQTRIIFCTGYSEDLIEGKNPLLGQAAFIAKPYFPDTLLETTRKMLAI